MTDFWKFIANTTYHARNSDKSKTIIKKMKKYVKKARYVLQIWPKFHSLISEFNPKKKISNKFTKLLVNEFTFL